MKFPNQLFILSRELFEATSWEDVRATCAALKELGLYSLPYPSINIRVPLSLDDALIVAAGGRPAPDDRFHIAPALRDSSGVDYLDVSVEGLEGRNTMSRIYSPHGWGEADTDKYNLAARIFVPFLIAMLAARNICKQTREHKLASLGIGGKKSDPTRRFRYVTTLTVPAIREETEDSTETGCEKTPHYRRGHIRHQPYGPRLELVRPVWIAPVFVNADKEWVRERSAYNVSPARALD